MAIGLLAARAPDGADVHMRLALLLEFRGDRVSRLETYVDVARALQAAGLSA